MNFFLFLFAAILIFMKATGRISWSWIVVGAVSIGLIFFTQISSTIMSLFRNITKSGDSDDVMDNPNAACGCGPGQLVLVKKRRRFGKDPSDTVTCQEFQKMSSRWYIAGCLN